MEFREYLGLARRWLWLFVLATAVAAAGAWLVSLSLPNRYASQATILVGQATRSGDPSYAALRISTDLALTYAQMATHEPVLQGVVDSLGLDAHWMSLRGLVRASAVAGSPLLEVRVIDTDPTRAQVIAQAVAEQLVEHSPTPKEREVMKRRDFVERQLDSLQVSIDQAQADLEDIEGQFALATSARVIAELQNRQTSRQRQMETWRTQYANLSSTIEGSEINSLEIIGPAVRGFRVGPNRQMNVFLAALIGLCLALAAVLVIEYLDDTVKTAENVEKRLGLPGLATIEIMPDVTHRADALIALRHPRSPTAEAYRALRTNLEFGLLDRAGKRVLITSANPGEGKSTTAANLAVVLAQGGARVVLVDTDLRRPSLHRFFGRSNSVGLTSLLLGRDAAAPADVLSAVDGVPELRVLTSGPLPPNPAEVLKSPRTAQVLERLSEDADVLVLDSPPLLVVADAAVLAACSDATVLVFECGSTRTDAARRALDTLAKVGVQPLGAVVNKLDRSRTGGYYYYYSYRYRYGEYYGSDGEGGDGEDDQQRPSRRDGRSGKGLVDRLREGLASLLG